MFNIIVCGHGEFASGIEKMLELIMGKQDNIAFLNFTGGMDMIMLSAKLKDVKKSLLGDETLFLVDIAGGTPYNASALIENSHVIGGFNIPLLFEAIDLKDSKYLSNVLPILITTGKDGISLYVKNNSTINDEDI